MAVPTLTSRLYTLLFRRTSTFALTIAVGALFFERAFDQGADAIYEHINEGVRARAVLDLELGEDWRMGNMPGNEGWTGFSVLPGRGDTCLELSCRLPFWPGVDPKT